MADENEFSQIDLKKEEKLHLLHNDLQKLTNFCLEENMSYIQIKSSADSFMNFDRKCSKRPKNALLTTSVTLAVCVGLISVAFHIEPSQRLLASFGRRTLIKVLPLADWTSLHGVNCFIPNLFIEDGEKTLVEEDCKNCSSISEIAILQTGTVEELANTYLYRDIPVILKNSIPPATTVDIQDIIQLYLSDDVMRLFTSCHFESSVKLKRKDHRKFLERISNGDKLQYYAHWENCFKEAAKLFRRLYKRPDVLPTSVELTPSNWIFICNNYTENKRIELPYDDQLVILIQLSGSLDLKFKPREPCAGQCTDIDARIPEGGTLFVPDFFYDIEYVTCNHGNSITVGLGGRLDI